mmetsp:Transcript_20202/g.38077  ORF Transcript_20202/g.38077 Transcript_20202/m.38077 type:complete len:105 (+) Transcript_20202:2105-2419(+)
MKMRLRSTQASFFQIQATDSANKEASSFLQSPSNRETIYYMVAEQDKILPERSAYMTTSCVNGKQHICLSHNIQIQKVNMQSVHFSVSNRAIREALSPIYNIGI